TTLKHERCHVAGLLEAGEAPRIEHIGSPTGKPGDAKAGPSTRNAESPRRGCAISNPAATRAAWVSPAGAATRATPTDPRTNMLHGGSEARKDGCAAGY